MNASDAPLLRPCSTVPGSSHVITEIAMETLVVLDVRVRLAVPWLGDGVKWARSTLALHPKPPNPKP